MLDVNLDISTNRNIGLDKINSVLSHLQKNARITHNYAAQ